MTTTLLDPVRVEDITAQAREVKFGVTLLRLVAWLLVGFGKVLGYCWLVPVWTFLAVREGWREVHPPRVTDVGAGPR